METWDTKQDKQTLLLLIPPLLHNTIDMPGVRPVLQRHQMWYILNQKCSFNLTWNMIYINSFPIHFSLSTNSLITWLFLLRTTLNWEMGTLRTGRQSVSELTLRLNFRIREDGTEKADYHCHPLWRSSVPSVTEHKLKQLLLGNKLKFCNLCSWCWWRVWNTQPDHRTWQQWQVCVTLHCPTCSTRFECVYGILGRAFGRSDTDVWENAGAQSSL